MRLEQPQGVIDSLVIGPVSGQDLLLVIYRTNKQSSRLPIEPELLTAAAAEVNALGHEGAETVGPFGDAMLAFLFIVHRQTLATFDHNSWLLTGLRGDHMGASSVTMLRLAFGPIHCRTAHHCY